MRIEHVALWVADLERMKDFYTRAFRGSASERYRNPHSGFQSYFIYYDSGARLELMQRDGIPPNALNELNEIMERQFAGNQNLKASSIGGVKVAANILNFMDSGQDQVILGSITQVDADLGARIQDLMFVFDNLADLGDRELQALLREVPNDRLGLALRGADAKVKEKITRNMSQRAAQILLEDMEARGPVRLSDVEGAQKEILAIVRRLADQGVISLMASAEEMV